MDFNKELAELKENLSTINIMKFLAGTVVSCGAMAAIVAALRNPVLGAKGLTKLMMRLGVFVLGCKAGDVAEKYFSEKVDELIDTFKKGKEELKNESTANK